MKKIKLLKTLLIPTIGITAIGTIAAVSTSCSSADVSVTSVSLNKKSLALEVGSYETLTATVHPENATDKSVTWSSTDSSVATVDDNGKVTAVGEGSATIIVTTNNGGYKDYCSVTVTYTAASYICVTANADSTIGLTNEGGNNPNLKYSLDGTHWAPLSDSEMLYIPANKKVYLIGDNANGWSLNELTYSHFETTGNISLSGNIMSLLDNGTGTLSSIPNDYCFNALFHHTTGITSVSKNFLPATGLTKDCYVNMFLGCSSLTTVPDLPATTLAEACYSGMFNDCTSLITAPALPATTLATKCYASMFGGCTSLITAPSLPATTLADSCYVNMFSHCESLTTAPVLPATTLATECYGGMFFTCSALVTAPTLPATTLANNCYKYIFAGCVNLTSIRIGYTGTVAGAPTDAFSSWVDLVPAIHGTFYYRGSDTLANFGLPSSWAINPN